MSAAAQAEPAKRRPPRSLTVPRSCLSCGRDFLSCASHIKKGRGKFCGVACANAAMRTTRSLEFRPLIWDNCIPEPNSGCWLWTKGITGSGYGAIIVHSRQRLAHRLSFELANPAVAVRRETVIRHRCDNRLCVNPDHLQAGSALDNYQDSRDRDRSCRGSRHPFSKLIEAQVSEIRAALASGVSCGHLAATYGVSDRCIGFIRDRETWRHVG